MNAVSNENRTSPRRVRDQIGGHRSTIRSRLRKLIGEAKQTGELRADVEQLMFDLIASEAAANIAALMGETKNSIARDPRRAIASPDRDDVITSEEAPTCSIVVVSIPASNR